MTEKELKEQGLNGRTEYMAYKDMVLSGEKYDEDMHDNANVQCVWCGIKANVDEESGSMLSGDKIIYNGVEITCSYCTCHRWEEFNPNAKEKQNINKDDICDNCGSVGEVKLMSCVCHNCNNIIWGC